MKEDILKITSTKTGKDYFNILYTKRPDIIKAIGTNNDLLLFISTTLYYLITVNITIKIETYKLEIYFIDNPEFESTFHNKLIVSIPRTENLDADIIAAIHVSFTILDGEPSHQNTNNQLPF